MGKNNLSLQTILCDKMDKIKKSIPKSWDIESIDHMAKGIKKGTRNRAKKQSGCYLPELWTNFRICYI